VGGSTPAPVASRRGSRRRARAEGLVTLCSRFVVPEAHLRRWRSDGRGDGLLTRSLGTPAEKSHRRASHGRCRRTCCSGRERPAGYLSERQSISGVGGQRSVDNSLWRRYLRKGGRRAEMKRSRQPCACSTTDGEAQICQSKHNNQYEECKQMWRCALSLACPLRSMVHSATTHPYISLLTPSVEELRYSK
jgi:hypothetical protein